MDDATLTFAIKSTSLAFGIPEATSSRWARLFPDDWRVVEHEGEKVGCAMMNSLGWWLGGRVLPGVGIAGVSVLPEHRGKGFARKLMQRLHEECFERGARVSLLYASTQSLYRGVGYEQAGTCFKLRIPLHTISADHAGMRVEELPRGVPDDVRRIHRAFLATYNGPMDRGPYMWSRVEQVRGEDRLGYGVYGDGLEGYVYLAQTSPIPGPSELMISDIAFSTPRAASALLGFLTRYATIAKEAVLACGPSHPLLLLLREQSYSLTKYEAFMARIIRVEDVLTERGYIAATVAPLTLVIEDPDLPQNSGSYGLALSDGQITVTRQAQGPSLKLGVRALSMMVSSYYSASQLAAIGLVEGDAQALRRADAVFAGTTPWLGDMF